MRAAVVGAGPTGLYLSMSLARRGHQVTIIDRDPGPATDEEWARKGVMQFHQPHYFRPQVRDALLAEVPEVAESLVAAGATLTPLNPAMPDFAGYRVRRLTFERVLRAATVAEPGVSLIVGHADRVRLDGSRASGVIVDGNVVDADLVIDAAGRSGRFTEGTRPPAIGGDSGFAYVSRQYRLRPGAEPGPTNGPPGWAGIYRGYLVIVFPQDAGTFQTLIVRAGDDTVLARARHEKVFDVVARAIPSIAVWIDPDRATPHTPPMAGARLLNSYRGQLTDDGRVGVHGLIFVGDAVLTTNPAAGRGVTTSMMQARQLLAILDEHGHDFDAATHDFDQWCVENMRPWFDDHVRWDAGLLSRWRGEDIDFSQPLTSDLICSVAEVDPSVMPVVGAYWSMLAEPSVLSGIEQRARERLESGFRPAVPEGPTRDELADLIVGITPLTP